MISTKLFRFQHPYILECGKGLMNIEQLTKKLVSSKVRSRPVLISRTCQLEMRAHVEQSRGKLKLLSTCWLLNSQEENWNCKAHVDRRCENSQKRKTHFIHTLLEKIGSTKLCEPQVLFCISWTCSHVPELRQSELKVIFSLLWENEMWNYPCELT